MFYTKEELKKIGFKSIGNNVLISDKCSIYGADKIEIGSNVRIDDFVILSPGTSLKIGNYVHIACYASLIGKGEIIIEDFVGVSGRVSIYSSTDDYLGFALTNPMIPEKFKRVTNGKVHIKKHSVIGSGSVIMPNVTINMGVSVYAQSLVKTDCDELTIYAGTPCKKIKNKMTDFLELEKQFLSEYPINQSPILVDDDDDDIIYVH